MTALLWILGVYFAILTVVLIISIFPPRVPVFFSPGSVGLPQESITFTTQDGVVIRAWWVQGTESKRVAVLCHGYLMNRSELAPLAIELHKLGYSSLLLDFRQHGKSGRSRCGMGFYEKQDVAAACKFAREKLETNPFILLAGSSMGSVACALALADDPQLADAIVLDSAYSKLPDAVLGWWSFLGGKVLRFLFSPVVLLSGPFVGFNPWTIDVAKAVAKIKQPKLFVHGEKDTLAEPSQAQRNFDAAHEPKEIIWFADCNHAEFRWEDWPGYSKRLVAWLTSVH